MRDYPFEVLNHPVDVSSEFARQENLFFIGTTLTEFDAEAAAGLIRWQRHARKVRMAFNQVSLPYEATEAWEFPPAYGEGYVLPFALNFISPRTVRIRLAARPLSRTDEPSVMLDGEPRDGEPWEVEETDESVVYTSSEGNQVVITRDPWHIAFRDADSRTLTRTQHLMDTRSLQNSDPTPFSFVRRARDLRRHFAAAFSLAPDEKLYGCGESFTRLNKRGQKLTLWTMDAHGAQTPDMYKPVPFLMSSRGYGMFIHTSTPITLDMGRSYDGANVMYVGDDTLDLFVFFGSPKEILAEYTALTGRSSVPPLWSFGLWMSRITYKSEQETRDVARKLRERRIPCDVIHLDTGWFEEDWRCDYEFSKTRFPDPEKMIADLRAQGFRISLWQLPYFTPRNALFETIIDHGYAVRDADGNLPTEDAIIDFSNPGAARWYQGLLARLLEMGVGAIKVDFGEAAPLDGVYYSGKSGFYEHNLYPLRYNEAAAGITEAVTEENIIFARSAWAGSQRYPLHWGGDAENTDCGMAASLRAGLSLGLCGFTFWSHDIGGFVRSSPEKLYRRWMPFGMLTSHSRCHGAPPKEPWAYGEAFEADFRRTCNLKYRLMPYVYAQACASAERGLPMLRALFLEYPEDPTSWFVEDQYLFGSDLLVAPLMEETTGRRVYLPPGSWVDYQTGRLYEGARWYTIQAGDIPVVLLVRSDAVIPHIRLAQSTDQMLWDEVDLVIFSSEHDEYTGLFRLPDEEELHQLTIEHDAGGFDLRVDPLEDRVRWNIITFDQFNT